MKVNRSPTWAPTSDGHPGHTDLGAFMFNGIYKFPSYYFTCTNVFTNKVPTDAYRGAGRPEATFAVERMMDELAAELSLDPLELRAKNWITHEEFPFDTVAGLTYDSGNYEAATAQARELFDYDGLRREQAERRERQDPVQLGIGVSDVHRDVRPGAVAGTRLARLRRGRMGACGYSGAADRQGRGGHRLVGTRSRS